MGAPRYLTKEAAGAVVVEKSRLVADLRPHRGAAGYSRRAVAAVQLPSHRIPPWAATEAAEAVAAQVHPWAAIGGGVLYPDYANTDVSCLCHYARARDAAHNHGQSPCRERDLSLG